MISEIIHHAIIHHSSCNAMGCDWMVHTAYATSCRWMWQAAWQTTVYYQPSLRIGEVIDRPYALVRLSTVATHWRGYCREILTLVCHQYLTYFTTFYLIINNILTILHIKDNMKTTEGTATGRHDMRVTNSLNPQTHYLCSNTFLYATTNNDN